MKATDVNKLIEAAVSAGLDITTIELEDGKVTLKARAAEPVKQDVVSEGIGPVNWAAQ